MPSEKISVYLGSCEDMIVSTNSGSSISEKMEHVPKLEINFGTNNNQESNVFQYIVTVRTSSGLTTFKTKLTKTNFDNIVYAMLNNKDDLIKFQSLGKPVIVRAGQIVSIV